MCIRIKILSNWWSNKLVLIRLILDIFPSSILLPTEFDKLDQFGEWSDSATDVASYSSTIRLTLNFWWFISILLWRLNRSTLFVMKMRLQSLRTTFFFTTQTTKQTQFYSTIQTMDNNHQTNNINCPGI